MQAEIDIRVTVEHGRKLQTKKTVSKGQEFSNFTLDLVRLGCRDLDLAFSTRELRDLCERRDCARQKLGPQVSEALRERLADFVAAKSPSDLLVGNPRIIICEDTEQMTVDLCEGYQIRFLANHPTSRRTHSAAIQWSKVNRIKITGIECFDD